MNPSSLQFQLTALGFSALGLAYLATCVMERREAARARANARKLAEDLEHMGVVNVLQSSWKPHRDRYGRFETVRRFTPPRKL